MAGIKDATAHSEPAIVTRRERARTATLTEIKQVALGLMREQGTTDVRFSDIARVMGLTAPALYRYYSGRDELLTDMITDGYHGLAAVLAEATRAAQASDDPFEQLSAVAFAYRTWALEDPQRFTLIFGLPVPGYVAPEEGPTVEAAQRAMANLAAVVHLAAADGRLGEPIISTVAPLVAESLKPGQKPAEVGGDLPAATHQAMVHCWTAMHGFVCLEAYGHFNWFAADVRDELYAAQIRLLGLAIGLEPVGGNAARG
jgi:AcrR family transcriptional regulator